MKEASARGVFRERFGSTPAVVASAPGRVNLVGGHTDYNEGFVLPAAIDRRTTVAARPRSDRRVRVHSVDFDETRTFPIDALTEAEGWAAYVAGVFDALGAGDLPGADLLVLGDVPQGAGLSSSAALEVAVAAAVAELGGLDIDPEGLAASAWRAETEFVGLNCGIMDQYAAALGRAGHALLLDCRTREAEHIPLPEACRIVVVDTTVEHELADSAYNDRVAECRRAVDSLVPLLGRDLSHLRDVTSEEFEAYGQSIPEPARRRARHVVREDERVQAAADALRAGDVLGAGSLMFDSHVSLRDDYEVSCPELDFVVELAREQSGVLGARMTGGGFGGSVVTLVRPDAVEPFGRAVERDFREAFGVDPDVYPCRAADGVAVERV